MRVIDNATERILREVLLRSVVMNVSPRHVYRSLMTINVTIPYMVMITSLPITLIKWHITVSGVDWERQRETERNVKLHLLM